MTTEYNPAQTDGFAFLEYASPDPQQLRSLFAMLGFTHVANHKQKAVELWQQNELYFLINKELNSSAATYAELHGPSTCGMAFKVADGEHAYQHTTDKGAKPFEHQANDWHDGNNIRAISGIGETALYFVDSDDFYQTEFNFIPGAVDTMRSNNAGLTYLDHVTHNVQRGNMNVWAQFYERLFNFREIRYFDIEGKHTGLLSRAMTGPCSKLRIPINESSDDKSQIEEFLKDLKGEGIQHIAMGSDNIYKTVEHLRAQGVDFMDTPATYYEKDRIEARVPQHGEPLDLMKQYGILIDGAPTPDGGRLLQIFTNTVIGPVFFEIIERKDDEGFGEGNFRALFESIEADQVERGVI